MLFEVKIQKFGSVTFLQSHCACSMALSEVENFIKIHVINGLDSFDIIWQLTYMTTYWLTERRGIRPVVHSVIT